MSEIEKMMQNAGVKKYWNSTPYGGVEEYYPPFTAEKQLLLIDFLSKYEITIIKESNTPYYMIYTYDKVGSVKANNIGELISKYINMFIWQDLTEEQKQQVKGILE